MIQITRQLLVDFYQLVKRYRQTYLIIVAAATLTGLFTARFDAEALVKIRIPNNPNLDQIAAAISDWGEPQISVLPPCLFLIAIGFYTKKVRYRRIGMACILSVLIAGALVNILRPTLGRPRPYTELPDKLYFFKLDHRYHGTPSGHMTASTAAAACLGVALPLTSPAVVLYAGSVGWSRMQLRRHHPTDIFLGCVLGCLVGIPFGYLGRQDESAAPRAEQPAPQPDPTDETS